MSVTTILSVAPYLPRPDEASGCRRYFAILELLARRYAVDLFSLTRNEGDDHCIRRLSSIGIRVLPNTIYGGMRTVSRMKQYDLGLFEFWHAAECHDDLFRRHQPWAKTIVDSVDLHFTREEAGAALGLMDAEGVSARKARELAIYNACDSVIVVTEPETEVLRSAGVGTASVVIPNIVPTRVRIPGPRACEVLFVGGFRHPPNADGLLWFVREVWPRIRICLPRAVLTVVGSHPTPEVLALDGKQGVTVCGYVQDTGPYLDRAAVSVAPLRYGGGMKGKVSEALAAGLPLVTTSHGAYGFGLGSGIHAVIADEADSFADAVCRLLQEEEFAANLGTTGQQFVMSSFGLQSIADRIYALVDSLVAKGGKRSLSWRWLASAIYLRLRATLHFSNTHPLPHRLSSNAV